MTQPTEALSQRTDKLGNFQGNNRQAAITAAVVAHSLNASYSQAQMEGVLDALGTVVNVIIETLEAHGLTADN